jgi:hypothetical protein
MIQCEPSNFLKESAKREIEIQNNCKMISDSFMEEESERGFRVKPRPKKEKQGVEDKENLGQCNFGKKSK